MFLQYLLKSGMTYKNVSMKREISILSGGAVEVLPKAKAAVTAK